MSGVDHTAVQQVCSLADRIRWVLKHFGLQHEALAEVMGVNVDRVKSLVLGRAHSLRHGELQALQIRFNLNMHWLTTGQGQPVAERVSEVDQIALLINKIAAANALDRDLFTASICATVDVLLARQQPLTGKFIGGLAQCVYDIAIISGMRSQPELMRFAEIATFVATGVRP